MTTVNSVASLRVHVRWMVRRDVGQVEAIEQANGWHPLTSGDILAANQSRNRISMVAECGETIVGYSMHDLHESRMAIARLVVPPDCRRLGIGGQIVAALQRKASQSYGRKSIVVDVPETMLEAQLFFRRMGFRAAKVLRGHYGTEDAYRMFWRVGGGE